MYTAEDIRNIMFTKSLGGYKTSEVDDKLKAYTNTEDLTTLLAGKVDTSTLESYYNKTQVDEALAKYTTTEALNTKFGDYFTKDEVNTELAKYVLTTTFTDEQTRVNGELAKKLEADALTPYLLSATAEATYWKKEDLTAMSNQDIEDVINGTYTE
jgi:DivIVA domain-containing protein